MIVDLEVHHARHGVRAVDRGRAAGFHFDAVHQLSRDHVDVGAGAAGSRIAIPQAVAVDQHQRALGVEAAQVHRRGAVRTVGHVRTLVREDLRQLIEHVLDAGRAHFLNFERRDEGHRADGGFIRNSDARTRHHHFAERRVGGRRRRGLGVGDAEGRSHRAAGQCDAYGRPQSRVSEIILEALQGSLGELAENNLFKKHLEQVCGGEWRRPREPKAFHGPRVHGCLDSRTSPDVPVSKYFYVPMGGE